MVKRETTMKFVYLLTIAALVTSVKGTPELRDEVVGCALEKYGEENVLTANGIRLMYSELTRGARHHLKIKHVETAEAFMSKYGDSVTLDEANGFVDDMFVGMTEKRKFSFLKRLKKSWC